ncbi:MAG: polysaccharide biosynthesis protein [Planctomycetia bacterium]|nr:polysaccharide biosynthesis protein [Planctomycetia bacterium]
MRPAISGDDRGESEPMTHEPMPHDRAPHRVPLRRLSRKSAVLLAVHAAIFAIAFFLAFYTRNDFTVHGHWLETFAATVGAVIAIKLVIFYSLGHCHVSWRRVAFGDLTGLLWAATLSLLVLAAIDGLFLSSGRVPGLQRVPRSVLLLDWAATILVIGGIRALWRSLREELRPLLSRRQGRRVMIVGATQAGELLARNLMTSASSPHSIVGFLDDDRSIHNTRFAGFEVLGGLERAAVEVTRHRIDDVIVQSGTLTGRKFRRLLDDCAAAGATVKVIPAIDELLEGRDERTHVRLRPVEIKDLLRREPVELDDTAIRRLVAGRTVMVTGAGGSIGSELCRQLIRFQPRKLLLVERGENALFLVEQEFSRLRPRPPFEPLIADVGDEQRIEQILSSHRPDVIFHAAAHKHVPMMEWNPAEAIKNNCLGTRTLARVADRFGVEKFVMISTDKAVNPTSVMGCSKLIAERFVQAFAKSARTKFVVVRFGNVLASNGSVVPTFQEQIRRGGPITVTDPEIKRYFMTIPEASQLVMQAAAMGSGGEIFVLDMGESVKIVDLARDLIGLSGLGDDDIEIVFTGLRPGEKLYEELYFDDERRMGTSHPKVFCALHRPAELADVESVIEELVSLAEATPEAIRGRLRDLVPEYGEHEGPAANTDRGADVQPA